MSREGTKKGDLCSPPATTATSKFEQGLIPGAESPFSDMSRWLEGGHGLDYLKDASELTFEQKLETLELVLDFEMNNKYTIRTQDGHKVYWAAELNSFLILNCCGAQRPFDVRLYDAGRNEVLRLTRPCRCSCFCCPWCLPCCLHEMDVISEGHVIDRVVQSWSTARPRFRVETPGGKIVLKIRGPVVPSNCLGGNVVFDIMTPDRKKRLGTITKKWSGFVRQMFTDTDFFAVSFPLKLDVQLKAVLLGALFLIDFMYFESRPADRHDNFGHHRMGYRHW